MYPSSSSPSSRKRPAPGASPVVPAQQMQQQQPSYPAAQPDQGLVWDNGAVGSDFGDATSRKASPYGLVPASPQFGQATSSAPSAILARRGMSQALVPATPRQVYDPNTGSWNNFGDDNFMQTPSTAMDENDNIELLEERAARAKREAQTKRKQIPPFVQKLSSFLDESKNTDLIRWSEKGDSFIVLDEDEFAKTLIPELFKHNKYPSFVRQLNMYGFHKRVGLSDNSMKASERKNKNPSEYYNPYFKRGHPNLLWLINKPKSGGSKKKGAKKEEGESDSDDGGAPDESLATPPFNSASQAGGRSRAVSAEVGPLQKKELVQVKSQLEKLQQQQLAISQLIERLRRDHNQLVTQAVMFQSMHERHENSINAILNFLANVFRKSLEDQGGAQSVSDLLASIIPGSQQMPLGSVVDLGDFVQQQGAEAPTIGTPKRQQRLLPPIPSAARARRMSPASTVPSASASPYKPQPDLQQIGSVTELLDTSPSDTTSPAYLKDELRTNPQQSMMKIIQGTNAGGTSSIDLPDMAANTPINMSSEQRNKMLNIMAGQASSGSAPLPTTTPVPAATPIPAAAPVPAAAPIPHTASNPITVPVPTTTGPSRTPSMPPPSNMSNSASPKMSLSPVFSSLQPPSLYDMGNTHNEIEALQHLQEDQASKLDELSALLGPLSPSGRIPGIDESGQPTGYFDNVDYDQFLEPVALDDLSYNGEASAQHSGDSMTGNDFDFGLGTTNGAQAGHDVDPIGDLTPGGRVVGAGFKNASLSPAGTEEIYRPDIDAPGHDSKRRRRI